MGLTQEALEGVPHGTFLEDAWPCFCLCMLTRSSKPGYYRMAYVAQEGLRGGELDPTPVCFLIPLTKDSRWSRWEPLAQGWTGTPRARSLQALNGGAEPQTLHLKEF